MFTSTWALNKKQRSRCDLERALCCLQLLEWNQKAPQHLNEPVHPLFSLHATSNG
jgi:hypothetical protein